MADSSDALENQLNPTSSSKPESMAEKLLQRKFAAGVALPQIRRRLARITKASSRIRQNRLVLPGHTQRQQIKKFNADLQHKQTKGPRVGSRTAAKRLSGSWDHLEMDLPNGAPADSSRSNVLRAGLDNAGFPSGGQVIAPFNPPPSSSTSSDEPSFVERRKARLAAQETKKTAASRQKPDSSSRLFSRVEEIKPSNEKKSGFPSAGEQDSFRTVEVGPTPVESPKLDHPEPKSSLKPIEPQSPHADQPKREKSEEVDPSGPKITPGKPSIVQREAARPSAPVPHDPAKDFHPELQHPTDSLPVLPTSSSEELPMDLRTLPEQKPTAGPAAEVQRVPLSKPEQSRKPSVEPQPRSEINPPVKPASREPEVKESRAVPRKELPAKPTRASQPLSEETQEVFPRPALPVRKPDEGQPINQLEKSPLDAPRPILKPSAASAPQTTLQREPEKNADPEVKVVPAAPEPDRTTPFQLPLDQPLAQRKNSARPEEEAAAQKLNLTDANQQPTGSREFSTNRQSDAIEKLKSAPSQDSLKAAVLHDKPQTIPESAFQDSAAVKPVVFQTVVARQRRKSRSPIQFSKRLAVHSAAIRRMYTPQRIRVQDAPNLIQRQAKRGASQEVQQVASAPAILEKGQIETKGLLPVNPQTTQPLEAPAEKNLLQRPAVRRADRKVSTAPLARSPLRLSLRVLTAAQAASAAVRLRKQDSGETIRRKKSSDLKPAQGNDQPLLLSQRRLLPDFGVKDIQNTEPSNVQSARSSAPAKSKPGTGVDSASSHLRLRGQRLLVTGSGRQLIQRQVREAHISSEKMNLPEKLSVQESADKTVLKQTGSPQQPLRIQHSERTESVQKSTQKQKNISDKVVKAIKSSDTISAFSEMNQLERPETELPVVSSKKISPIEPVVQHEMAVQGPVVQRAMAEPMENTSSPSQDTSGEPLDLDQLAREVYPIIKRMIAVERERSIGRLF